MNLIFYALWMLCGLGAAVFATVEPGGRQRPLGLALGFAAAAVLALPGRLPDPAWTGGVVVLVAVFQLVRPGQRGLAAVCGGVLAGLWSALLKAQGAPLTLAVGLAAALPAVSTWLTARRPAFAPPALREEALLIVLGLALVVTVAPEVHGGWRSAVALNLGVEDTPREGVPPWGLLLSGAVLALGGFRSFWRRH